MCAFPIIISLWGSESLRGMFKIFAYGKNFSNPGSPFIPQRDQHAVILLARESGSSRLTIPHLVTPFPSLASGCS